MGGGWRLGVQESNGCLACGAMAHTSPLKKGMDGRGQTLKETCRDKQRGGWNSRPIGIGRTALINDEVDTADRDDEIERPRGPGLGLPLMNSLKGEMKAAAMTLAL